MNVGPTWAILAREAFDAESVRRGAQRPTSLDARDWALVATVAVLVVLVLAVWSWYMDRREQRRPVNSPLRLFWALCGAHQLRWTDRWILWRLARYQRLDDPARVFLEPQRLSTANLSPALRQRHSEIKTLREILFADLPAPDPVATAATPPLLEPSVPPVRLPKPSLDVPPWPDRREPRGP